jgi:proline iminopeptidase
MFAIAVFSSTMALAAARETTLQKGYVATHDGSKLYYEKIGSGRVIIAPGRLFLFESFRQLGDHYTLISYDMRNRGKSEHIDDGSKLTIQNDVRDLETVRQHFGVAKFTPVGYSYLGLMVVMYAMEHPDRVERIVQLGPVPLKFGTRYPPDEMQNDRDRVPDPKARQELEQLQKSGFAESHPQEFCEKSWDVDRFVLVGNPSNVGKLGKSQCDMPNEWPVNLNKHFQYAFTSVQKLDIPKEELKKVAMPVLTIHGTKDRNAPYGSGKDWARNLPDARLVTIKGGAHQSFVEYPEHVFPAIRTFMDGKWPAQAEKVNRQ